MLPSIRTKLTLIVAAAIIAEELEQRMLVFKI